MVDLVVPGITDIGAFILQLIFAMILWQIYQFVKARIELEQLRVERTKLQIQNEKPKPLQELNGDIQKPDSISEKIEHTLKRAMRKEKKDVLQG